MLKYHHHNRKKSSNHCPLTYLNIWYNFYWLLNFYFTTNLINDFTKHPYKQNITLGFILVILSLLLLFFNICICLQFSIICTVCHFWLLRRSPFHLPPVPNHIGHTILHLYSDNQTPWPISNHERLRLSDISMAVIVNWHLKAEKHSLAFRISEHPAQAYFSASQKTKPEPHGGTFLRNYPMEGLEW